MPTQPTRNRLRAAGAPLAAVLLCVAVSACGSSNKAKTATNTTSAVTYASVVSAASSATPGVSHPSGATGGGSQNGGTPSSNGSSPGTSNPGSNNNSSNNTQNPSAQQHSNTHSKYPPALVAALKSFAGCVRSHGLNIGEPNLSGHGEVFSSKGINPNDPGYRKALEGCEAQLLAILRIASGTHSHLPGV